MAAPNSLLHRRILVSPFAGIMSPMGQKRGFEDAAGTSALQPIASVCCVTASDVEGRKPMAVQRKFDQSY